MSAMNGLNIVLLFVIIVVIIIIDNDLINLAFPRFLFPVLVSVSILILDILK